MRKHIIQQDFLSNPRTTRRVVFIDRYPRRKVTCSACFNLYCFWHEWETQLFCIDLPDTAVVLCPLNFLKKEIYFTHFFVNFSRDWTNKALPRGSNSSSATPPVWAIGDGDDLLLRI